MPEVKSTGHHGHMATRIGQNGKKTIAEAFTMPPVCPHQTAINYHFATPYLVACIFLLWQ